MSHQGAAVIKESLASSSTPTRVGRYVVLGEIARGGMAQVLLARQPGPGGFSRPVVIKRLLPEVAQDSSLKDSLVDEARIASRIQHPNVVEVLDFGSEAQTPYLVLQYLQGETTSALMRRLALLGMELPYPTAAHIVAEACAGLHAAHELRDDEDKLLGLVHRDVSHQNLFVTYDGHVKLLDFGIARTPDRETKTETGHVKGKFAYMSPEQCLAQPLDRTSDIFALGVVLYELSLGRRLFRRDNMMLVFKAICEEPVIPPREIVSSYPPELEAVVMRALSRRPTDRYRSAAEMRRDLLGCLSSMLSRDMPEESLSDMMHNVFVDRIQEKKGFLTRVRTGEHTTDPPIGDTLDAIELPDAAASPQQSNTALLKVPRPSRSPSPWVGMRAVWASLAIAATLLATVLGWKLQRTREAQSEGPHPVGLVATQSGAGTPQIEQESVDPAPAAAVVGAEVPAALATTGPAAPTVPAEGDEAPAMNATDREEPGEAPAPISPSSANPAPTPVSEGGELEHEAVAVQAEAEPPAEAGTTVRLRTSPVRVQVRLDGNEVGRTPLRLRLSQGEHELTLWRRGYSSRTETIQVGERPMRITRRLARRPRPPASPAQNTDFRRFE